MPKKKLPVTTKAYSSNNKNLTEDRVLDLARIQCTMSEIAACCKCSVQTLENRFLDIIKRGYEEGRESLRRAQVKKAMEGNPTMLIWCGKHILKQREVIEIDNSSKINDVQKVLQHIKSLDRNAEIEECKADLHQCSGTGCKVCEEDETDEDRVNSHGYRK